LTSIQRNLAEIKDKRMENVETKKIKLRKEKKKKEIRAGIAH